MGLQIKGSTHQRPEIEGARYELAAAPEASNNGDGICHIQPRHGQRKGGVDRLVSRKREQSHRDSQNCVVPHRVDRGLGIAAEIVQPAGER